MEQQLKFLSNNHLWTEMEKFIIDNYDQLFHEIYLPYINEFLRNTDNEFLKISLVHDFGPRILRMLSNTKSDLSFSVLNESGKTCYICMDELQLNETIVICQKCFKVLGHFTCLDKWLYSCTDQHKLCDC